MKLLLAGIVISLILASSCRQEKVEQLEFPPVYINGGELDLFEIIDDDTINRDEMNRMIDEIWPAGTRRPSR